MAKTKPNNSDTGANLGFEAKHAELEAQMTQGADPEDPDEYRAVSIFWVPKKGRWQHLKASAPQATIGTLVDDTMAAIERDNPSLRGVLPKDFARAGLDKQRLGQIINLVSDREADVYELWDRLPDARTHLLIRACRDRNLATVRGSTLFVWMDEQPVQGS